MTVATDKGLKRICTQCGTRFYDLFRRPIICPACQTEFKGEVKLRARRGRPASQDLHEADEEDVVVVPVAKSVGKAKAPIADADDDEDEDSDDDTLVSLETLETDDDALDDLDDDDLDSDLKVDLDSDDDK